MPRILLAAALAFALIGCDTTVKRSEVASVDYGPKPEHWQGEIRSYLDLRLHDPKSAIVQFRTEPKMLYQKETAVRARQYGWAVCVWVNDRNSTGAFDGFYPMTVFLRNEKIVAVNDGPDDFGIIGAKYAREQCEQLGAPFRD